MLAPAAAAKLYATWAMVSCMPPFKARVEGEGTLWYIINYGEYVRASDLTVVAASDFTGV
jgi:hypothetical protein